MAARGASLKAALEATRHPLRLRWEARQARWEERRFALESWEMFRMNDKGSDDGEVGERLSKVRVGAARGGGGEVGDSGGVVCSVCLEGMEAEEMAEEMPCKHLYYESCLAEWFKQSRTCPQCRYKMH